MEYPKSKNRPFIAFLETRPEGFKRKFWWTQDKATIGYQIPDHPFVAILLAEMVGWGRD